jgi:Outer membrane protein beta-barrel domain
MQKTFFLKITAIAATLLLSIVSFAQISVGAKGGLNVSNLSGVDETNYDTKALVGFHVGGFVTFNLGRNFAIQPELVYSTQGGTIESGSATEDLKLNYFNIPVMVKFMTNNGFYLEAGPQLGFNTGDLDFDNVEASVESSDFSICGGLGFQPTKSPFGIGARYNAGMGTTGEIDFDNASVDNADFKNGVFQLSIYWRLFGGGKLKK